MTLKLLTMTRNGGLVLASGLFFGETITPLEGAGYGGLMVCFGLYTWVKASEAQAAAREPERSEMTMELGGSGAISPSETAVLTETETDGDNDSSESATKPYRYRGVR